MHHTLVVSPRHICFLYADLIRSSLAVVAAVHGCQNVFRARSYVRTKNSGVITPTQIVFATLIVVLVVRGITSYSIVALCGRCSTGRRKRLLSKLCTYIEGYQYDHLCPLKLLSGVEDKVRNGSMRGDRIALSCL